MNDTPWVRDISLADVEFAERERDYFANCIARALVDGRSPLDTDLADFARSRATHREWWDQYTRQVKAAGERSSLRRARRAQAESAA